MTIIKDAEFEKVAGENKKSKEVELEKSESSLRTFLFVFVFSGCTAMEIWGNGAGWIWILAIVVLMRE